jgi:hypothetical protein
MTTLPGETVLWKSASGALILTTHRVRYRGGTGNNLMLISIMLEEIASVSLIRTSNIALLVLGIIVALAGIAAGVVSETNSVPMTIGLFIGGVLIVLYLATRQTLLSFQSAGASIRTAATGLKLPEILQLIDGIDAAKNQRSLLLAGK